MNDMNCTLCGSIYDELDHVPLMVPECGHTFCKSCIQLQLQQVQGKSFLCPEDNEESLRTNINQFPTNSVLSKFIQKQRQQPLFDITEHPHQNAFKIKYSDDDVQLVDLCSQQDEEPIDLCPEHFLKLDIVCLTDRARVCTKCALFGQHKHHEFKSVEDVVKEVTLNAENIMYIYQKIQNKEVDLNEQKCFELLQERFQSVYKEGQATVRDKFKEIHQLLLAKEQKMIEQVNQMINSLEQQSRKQISEIISQSSTSVELWKITAKDRLLYFSQTTEVGQLPLDLYNSKFCSFEKGQEILQQIDTTLNIIEQKRQNVNFNKLKLELKHQDFEKNLDTIFTMSLQNVSEYKSGIFQSTGNNQKVTESPSDLRSQCQLRPEQDLMCGDSIILQGDAFSSFYFDDPMLLKDASLADWNDSIQGNFNYNTEVVKKTSIDRHQQVTPQRSQLELRKNIIKLSDKNFEKKSDLVQKHSYESSQSKLQTFQNSPANRIIKNQDENRLFLGIRSGISPTPRVPIDKKKKAFKINEKFEQIWQAMKSDAGEILDFSNAELQDEGIIMIANIVRQSKKLKTLKVARNRITDDGACKLLDALWSNQYQQFASLHMQSNLVTEKTLDYYIQLAKQGPSQGSLPRNIYLNLNLVNISKCKKKIEEIRKFGFIITI